MSTGYKLFDMLAGAGFGLILLGIGVAIFMWLFAAGAHVSCWAFHTWCWVAG